MDIVERAKAAGMGRYFCRRCADRNILRDADERQCWGVYAGTYCDECWAKDGRNRDDAFDPMAAGERMDENDP